MGTVVLGSARSVEASSAVGSTAIAAVSTAVVLGFKTAVAEIADIGAAATAVNPEFVAITAE